MNIYSRSLAVIVLAVFLAGCVGPQYRGGNHRGSKHSHRDRADNHGKYQGHAKKKGKRNNHKGSFCPPGQAKKGRC